MSLCSIKQFRISSALDDRRELSNSLRAHIDSCSGCQQFLKAHQALETKLKTGTFTSEPPAWLHTKVMAQVNSAPPTPSAQPRWIPAVAGIAAIGIAFAVVTMTVKSPSEPPHPVAIQLPAPTTPVHPASVTTSIEKHAKKALGKEFRDIATDISGARNFLSASLRSTIPGMRIEE